MITQARPYIDDLIAADNTNQKAHDMKLTTILYNVRKRGFVVHVKNSIIMNDKLKFLRIHIDKSGIKPYVKE